MPLSPRPFARLLVAAALLGAPPAHAQASAPSAAPSLDLVFAGTMHGGNVFRGTRIPPGLLSHPVETFGYAGPEPLQRTDEIAARVGGKFGLLFVPVMPESAHGMVTFRFITRNAADASPEAADAEASTFSCFPNVVCDAEFVFDKPSEIVPGDWIFEIRSLSGELLIKHRFHVTTAPDAVPPPAAPRPGTSA